MPTINNLKKSITELEISSTMQVIRKIRDNRRQNLSAKKTNTAKKAKGGGSKKKKADKKQKLLDILSSASDEQKLELLKQLEDGNT